MPAPHRVSVRKRIRDEIRRVGRHPAPVERPDEHPGDTTSPREVALQAESYERYRKALADLKPRDREMIVARVEAQWSMGEIARQFGMRTVDGARMAVTRALKKLSANMSA